MNLMHTNEQVLEALADIMQISVEDLTKKYGHASGRVMDAQVVAITILHRREKMTWYALRDRFNKANHASIAHCLWKYDDYTRLYSDFRSMVASINKQLDAAILSIEAINSLKISEHEKSCTSTGAGESCPEEVMADR